MFQKIKLFLGDCKEKRIERRNMPWSKKKKIIFISVFCAVIIYVAVSMIISGNAAHVQDFSLPSLNISVNGLDTVLICLSGIGFAIFKIRAYIKRRKGKRK